MQTKWTANYADEKTLYVKADNMIKSLNLLSLILQICFIGL